MRTRSFFVPILCCLALVTGSAAAEGLLGASPAKPMEGQPPAAAALPDKAVEPGSPLAAVKPFYDHIGLELDPRERNRFIDPARSVLDKADALEKSGEGDCLDPNIALDNVVDQQAEIAKSLKMLDAAKNDDAKVIVAFVAQGKPHRLEWKLTKQGGDWKVSDILSVTGEWALSQYQCE
ncbi:MAG TPA: hypothetical protein VGM46_06230 [Mesorhizobium sp.]